MGASSLAPSLLMPVLSRLASENRAPVFISNPNVELPGASQFLEIPRGSFDHLCWLGTGSMFLAENGHRWEGILDTIQHSGFFRPRSKPEIVNQDAWLRRNLEKFIRGHERDPILLWCRGMIWSRRVGAYQAFRSEARFESVQLSREYLFDEPATMWFEHPSNGSGRQVVRVPPAMWEYPAWLGDDSERRLVKVRRELRIAQPNGRYHFSFSEQLGVARRSSELDSYLRRSLHPAELELTHPVFLDSSGERLVFGEPPSATDARLGLTDTVKVPRLLSRSGLFDFAEIMAWRVRQVATPSGAVGLLIDDFRFALHRSSGTLIHVTTGSDQFRWGFANPAMTAWGILLSSNL